MARRGRGRVETREPERKSGAKAAAPVRVANGKAPTGRFAHIYAALDLGTNNCRLLIAKPNGDGFRVIDSYSRTVRLGEGLDESGYLAPEAMGRALTALRVCAVKMRRRGVTRTRAIATEACRLAGNGLKFIERVAKETGLRLDIIPADDEARLAVAGCAALVDRSYDAVLIVDIGGGSTELVWLDLRKLNDSPREAVSAAAIVAWTSLPLGVVNLAERFGTGALSTREYEAMVAEVRDHLDGFDDADELRAAFDAGRVHMLGTSGTVTTLAGAHLRLPRYSRARVDGVWMDAEAARALGRRLAGMTKEERMAVPCVGSDRAELVVAGCAILEAIFSVWPCRKLRIADRGLREGMLLALMEKADRERPRRSRPPRRRPVAVPARH